MFRTLLFATALLTSSTLVAALPSHFMKDAIQGDYSEATLGKTIQQRGSSTEVRQFGSTLVKDHSAGLSQAQKVASRLHLHIRPSMMPAARNELAKLKRMRGKAFDREVKRYMVQDHEHDLAEFKEQAKDGDRTTAAFAAATIPVLQKHLTIARSIHD